MVVQNQGGEMIELTLPYPVSANRYWRTVWPNGARCPVTTVSAQARAYKTQVRRLALQYPKLPIQNVLLSSDYVSPALVQTVSRCWNAH